MDKSTRAAHRRSTRTELRFETLESRRLLATVTLSPVKDVTLYQDTVPKANGSGTGMFAGSASFGSIRRGLIAFDVSQIPPSSVIDNVELRLTTAATSGVSAAQTVSVHEVLSDWGEGISHAGADEEEGTQPAIGDATWQYRRFDTQPWDTPGGDFDLAALASTVVDGVGQYRWSSQAMIDMVQDWVDLPETNQGWLLRGNESGRAAPKRFHTRESSVPSSRPILFVEFFPADAVNVSIAGTTAEEGDTNVNTFDFEVTLSKAPDLPVTVEYATRPGTATEGVDYTATSGQLIFNPGDSLTKTISVLVQGDLIDEDDERFVVEITSLTGGELLGASEAEGVILDDDPLPVLEVEDTSVDEGDDGLTVVELTVSLSAESSKQVTVLYETLDDSATEEDGDYLAGFGQLVWAPGETEATIELQVRGDEDQEEDEVFQVRLLNPSNAELSVQRVSVTIINDDVQLVHPWHNHDFPQDVDGNGVVVPLDALLVINRLNSLGAGPLAIPPVEPNVPPPYVDVNGDDFLAPIDALLIINYLNNPPPMAALATTDPHRLRADERLSAGRPTDELADGLVAAAFADENWLDTLDADRRRPHRRTI